MKKLEYTEQLLKRVKPTWLDAETSLAHFSIITYMVNPEALRPHIHERFDLDCIHNDKGEEKALISVVPFEDRDFRISVLPYPKWNFGQTNYRAYVTDRVTGEHVVWFFGTTLSSLTVAVPRCAWKIPWHYGKIKFQTTYNTDSHLYEKYEMTTDSTWGPADVKLEDTGVAPHTLQGFPNLETALVFLTHPLKGYFYRRDNALGSYSIWHEKFNLTEGNAIQAKFPLLERLGLVMCGDLSSIHSVLLQRYIDFTIYLPPVKI